MNMRTFLLSMICFFALATAMGQTVPRQFVAIEDGTGTWCQYCPGAAMGCDDLLANGKLVAVIANHNSDPYANVYSNTRNTMWGISTPTGAFPSITFDGSLGYVGGSHSSSLYTTYLPKYNAAIAVPSPVSMSMTVNQTGLNFTAVVTIEKVDALTSTNNVLYFFVTQSNIIQNWQGQTHLEHVNRLMVPDQNGTVISFSSGNIQTVTLNFTMNSAWPLESCEFIAFLQNKDGGQGIIPGTAAYPINKYVVYQCIKKGAADLTADFTADVTALPKNGTATFSATSTGGFIGTPRTYLWSFPGGTPSTSTEANPSVAYSECGPHDVTLILGDGGDLDTVTKVAYIQVGPVINLYTTPNDTTCEYQPITLYAYPAGATYLWTPGGATTQSIVVAAGDVGLGEHTYSVDVTMEGCTNTKTQTIFFDACSGIPAAKTEASVAVMPNPNNGKFEIDLNGFSGSADLTIVNALGTTVYSEKQVTVNGALVKTVDLSGNPPGVYFLMIRTGEQKITRKIVLQ